MFIIKTKLIYSYITRHIIMKSIKSISKRIHQQANFFVSKKTKRRHNKSKKRAINKYALRHKHKLTTKKIKNLI